MEPRRTETAIDILRRRDPIDPAALPDVDGPTAARIRSRIVATPRQPELSMRRRPRWKLRLAIAGLAALAVAAGWVILTRDVTEPQVVSCYEAADLGADIVAVRAVTPDGSACEPLWRSGVLSNPEVAARGEAPDLIECVNDAGALAVFPGADPDLCRRLDLARPTDQPVTDPRTVIDLGERLLDYFAATECAPLDAAVQRAEAIVAELPLPGWRVVATTGEPDRICGSHSIDPSMRTVYIVPIPHP